MVEILPVLTLIAAISTAGLLAVHLMRARSAEREAREELSRGLATFSQTLSSQMGATATVQNAQFETLRGAVEHRLERIQQDNAAKLEQMRQTVDEKLQSTLEKRLSESFRQVSERLELVHKGLGEMQTLAAGVGDLKRVLSNVKTRGVFGETQLAALLEQVMAPEQYEKNVATRPGSSARVEFAIKLPGRDDVPVLLPIDAKFPIEDYQRLQAAQEAGDKAALEMAEKALEARVKLEAKTIAEKYVEPPHTTDFALLYLPFEGLFGEVLRRPGLFDHIQRQFRVTICGPTNLLAYLNSLQMGFRTLAIQQRSSEVWKVLGTVKSEFGKFAEVLANTKRQLQTVANTIDQAEVRTRQIERKLKDVEVLPGAEVAQENLQLEEDRPVGDLVRLPKG
jgi:DNA recombination protein RmuC